MKNFAESDYAANKNSKNIVYRFADKTVEITLESYLLENPDKTPADFAELKALSDKDYYDTDRGDYRQTWKNTSFAGLEDTTLFAASSPEDEVIHRAEQSEEQANRDAKAKKALDKLTDVQRRRFIQYHVKGLTSREIVKIESVDHKTVLESLWAAEKKIKKVLAEA